MLFYITKDNNDGTKEVVKEINCNKEEAYEMFQQIVDEQCYEYHTAKTLARWRVIRLFDSKDNQIAQES